MFGYPDIYLLMVVLVCMNPVIIQRVLSSSVGQPMFNMTFVVWYNNSGDKPISHDCGKYYAQTFLNSYVRTEKLLKNESSCGRDNKLNVVLGLKARVKLLGQKIELYTYINISLVSDQLDNSTMAQILECAQVLNETLADPEQLQKEHNKYSLDPLYHIDLLQIPKEKNCEKITLNPEAFLYDEGHWVCEDLSHYFSPQLYKCLPYSRVTTTIPIATTLGSKDPGVKKSTLSIPVNKPWAVRLTNSTSVLTIKEGNDPVTVGFKVAVNRTLLCGSSQHCKIIVNIVVKASPLDVLRCRSSGEVIPQIVFVKPSWGGKREVCSLKMDINSTQEETRYIQLAPMLDGKYDGIQQRDLSFSVRSIIDEEAGPSETDALMLPLIIQDQDMKATCQSINDPHIATFDGYEYNNFYEGEFVLYEHLYLPYKVHVIYQKCGPGVPASCNCAVAVQSGDDVIVINRCYRQKKPFNRLFGTFNPNITILTVDMYLNNDLTPGTTIFEEADGKKYVIYLPHGGTVKIMASNELLNVWVIASPKDKFKTRGLCGTYDEQLSNDFTLKEGRIINYNKPFGGYRLQPREFCLNWRVDLYGPDSLFSGVKREITPQDLPVFCDCSKDYPLCGYAVDVSLCDVLYGRDITKFLIERARSPQVTSVRRRRSIEDNTISVIPEDPILIDTNFVPPNHTWANSGWTAYTAQQFCSAYVKDQYDIGQLCTEIPAVNFNQEITTCIEDIQITGNTSWKNSARDAMKEQCLEEAQRNSSLPKDIADRVKNSICINDCSGHGQCVAGRCTCEINWTSADCSESVNQVPYTSQLPSTGLCDTRYMNCKRVIVYGTNFTRNPNLTCFLQEAEISDNPKEFSALPIITKQTALFINFNAVECPIPDLKTFLVRVSNDGVFDHSSDPLLFIPFDSACTTCSTNTTSCTKRKNSCKIDGKCFQENQKSPSDPCLVCKPHAHDLEWTTDNDNNCRPSWWQNFSVPNWVIALIAALGGSLVGVFCGFLIYKCCCKKKNKKKSSHHQYHHNNHHPHNPHHPEDNNSEIDNARQEQPEETSPFEEAMLHRNRGLPTFSDDRFLDIAFQQPEYDPTTYNYSHHNGAEPGGGQTRVDSTTYF